MTVFRVLVLYLRNRGFDLHEISNLSLNYSNGIPENFLVRIGAGTHAQDLWMHEHAMILACACFCLVRSYVCLSLLLSHELKFKILERSKLSLRRYLQNNTDIKKSSIFNVFCIFPQFFTSKGYKDGKFLNNNFLVTRYQNVPIKRKQCLLF